MRVKGQPPELTNMNVSQIPKEVLAIAILIAGLIFFMILDPPKTQCDVQIELFKKSQNTFIFPQDIKNGSKKPDFDKYLSHCQEANGPGGCYELFQHLKHFNHDLNAVPSQCQSSVASIGEVKKIFEKSIAVLIQLAWGYQPPLSPNLKQGWLDQSETHYFCLLKNDYIRLYGDDSLNQLSDRVLMDLPDAKKITDKQTLTQLSLISINCK